MTLRIRWLGRVAYDDAWVLQRAFFEDRTSGDDWLLLLEHPHVYTVGIRGDTTNLLVDPASVGAELVHTDRGGDITYHGPGQLVGYPIVTVATGPGAISRHVRSVEQLVIDALGDVGLAGAGRLDGYHGVWVGLDDPSCTPRKIAAVGLRLSRGRSMHGFALNVDPELGMFHSIIPCGIADKAVTSLAAEGVEVAMGDVVDAVIDRAVRCWGAGAHDGLVRPLPSYAASLVALARGHGVEPAAGRELVLAGAATDPEVLSVLADLQAVRRSVDLSRSAATQQRGSSLRPFW